MGRSRGRNRLGGEFLVSRLLSGRLRGVGFGQCGRRSGVVSFGYTGDQRTF